MPGGNQLKAEVLNTSACSLCGACLDWCPYLKNLEDHLVLRFDCPVNDGRCYAVCPRTMTDWEAVQQHCFPDLSPGVEMGRYTAVYRVRAQHSIERVQDGGVVSTLLLTALHGRMVDGLLLTGRDEPLIPAPLLTDETDEVVRSAGSRFLASPGLRKITEAQNKGWQRLAVVGRPCQIQALRKMQLNQPADKQPLEILSIGLFCLWSLSWSFLDYLQEEYPGLSFTRMAIPQHGVELYAGEETRVVPTEKVREYVRPGCHYCLDMTSELADISVGAFEAEAGWNTVIVRSQSGADLLAKAQKDDLLLVEEYPVVELERLRIASLRKKARNLGLIAKAVEDGLFPGFINLDADIYQRIKGQAEGTVNS
ncbi:MAG: Coenzyme F420 hydrogenase/dehydrogenase, beta subunit C-terminal domain [Methylocystaceae bacterium]